MTVTHPALVSAAAALRRAFQHPAGTPAHAESQVRDLAVYDTAFGIDAEAMRPR